MNTGGPSDGRSREGCLHPELFLLLLPAAFVWWKLRTREALTDGVRALALALLVLALTRPYLETASGRDLVFVVDRSPSMPRARGQSGLRS
jgi:hypothetical protein